MSPNPAGGDPGDLHGGERSRGLLFGFLSDPLGTQQRMINALIQSGRIVPIWAYAPSLACWSSEISCQFMVPGSVGAIIRGRTLGISHDSVRGLLLDYYQCGVLLGGSVRYGEAILEKNTSYANAMAMTAFLVSRCAAPG